MLRITEIPSDGKTIVLRLDGRVTGDWVSALEKTSLHHRGENNETVLLDFGGVTFIGDRGVRMLERIKDEHIKIINCPLYIKALLRKLIIADEDKNGKAG